MMPRPGPRSTGEATGMIDIRSLCSTNLETGSKKMRGKVSDKASKTIKLSGINRPDIQSRTIQFAIRTMTESGIKKTVGMGTGQDRRETVYIEVAINRGEIGRRTASREAGTIKAGKPPDNILDRARAETAGR